MDQILRGLIDSIPDTGLREEIRRYLIRHNSLGNSRIDSIERELFRSSSGCFKTETGTTVNFTVSYRTTLPEDI